MGVLLDLIRDLIRKGPDTKILVYSQWMDSLSMLKVILESWRVNGLIRRENYINCLLMTRKHNYESTSVFRESKNMPVFLMLLQQGNNGLDMSVASHIISASVCIYPVSRIAMEAQAVARVQRIGQKNETYVHYIIADDTIESKM